MITKIMDRFLAKNKETVSFQKLQTLLPSCRGFVVIKTIRFEVQ